MSRQLSLCNFIGPSAKRRHNEEEENQNDEGVSIPSQDESVDGAGCCSSDKNDVTADDLAPTQDCLPRQPTDLQFPTTNFSGKTRSFNPRWFGQYRWLEYSVKNDAAYCFACRLFGSSSIGNSRPEKAFTSAGFRDWKHATGSYGKLFTHNNSLSHKQAVVAWKQFKATSQTGSIAEQLWNNRREIIEKNRHYIKTVAEILLLCCQQDVPLRGHDESITSLNKGNFKEFLSLVANHDPVVAEKLKRGPRNAIYTSPNIQNNIIHIMASIVREQIRTQIHKTGYYSILADETKDMSKQEQLSLVLRYIDHEHKDQDGVVTPSVVERFLTFVVASNLTAEHLSKYILDTLSLFNLDVNMIVSQGYDGASVMSGCRAGVQQRIKDVVPHAIYVHCHAHCLNLVLVDCVKTNSHASDFFLCCSITICFHVHQ